MAKTTYKEKLLDPRWQKKRLEIFNRDNWTCQLCGDESTTLHVHHKEYQGYQNPWEYEESFLVSYCAHCHGLVEFGEKNIAYKKVLKVDAIDGLARYICIDINDRLYIRAFDTYNNTIISVISIGKENMNMIIQFFQNNKESNG